MRNPQFPLLLILKEKHDDIHYTVLSKEGLHKAALKIIEDRLDPRYGYYQRVCRFNSFEDFFENHSGISLEDFNKKLESIGEMKDKVKWQDSNIFMSEYVQEIEKSYKSAKKEDLTIDMADKALEEKDGAAAWVVLLKRRYHQYENIEILNPTIYE